MWLASWAYDGKIKILGLCLAVDSQSKHTMLKQVNYDLSGYHNYIMNNSLDIQVDDNINCLLLKSKRDCCLMISIITLIKLSMKVNSALLL